MPQKRNYRRYKRKTKKNTTKKARAKVRTTVFPKLVKTTLRYVDDIALDAPTGGIAQHYFRANDCYDPDYTGAGHQPRGFDQYMAMYDKFRVVSSTATVRFTNAGAGSAESSQYDTVVGIRLDTSATSLTDITDVLEAKSANWKVLSNGSTDGLMSRSKFSYKTWFSSTSNDTVNWGTSTDSPLQLVYYGIYCSAIGSGDNPIDIHAIVQIDYDLEFFDPKYITQS